MNVQEFIRESLFQIASAVYEVNELFAERGLAARANPDNAEIKSAGGTRYQAVGDTRDVAFDIAVTVTRSEGVSNAKGGGLDLKVVSGGIGGESTSESALESISHLEFKIALKLPRPNR